jgi:ankyrin repeat protein
VDILLEAKANVNFCDTSGRFPILEAARLQEPTIYKKLLDHGAAINVTDAQGTSIIMLLLNNNASVEDLKFLIERGADIKLVDNNGHDALWRYENIN